MRSDMAKVLVERPRWNPGRSGGGTRGELQRLPIEEWRAREGMKARWQGTTKGFTDLLGPLRRFLRSRVGRPWNRVYSEICAEVRGGFPVREHFQSHVFSLVARDVLLIDGVPCHRGGYAEGRPLKWSPWGSFYVCPKTGLLKEPRRPRKGR